MYARYTSIKVKLPSILVALARYLTCLTTANKNPSALQIYKGFYIHYLHYQSEVEDWVVSYLEKGNENTKLPLLPVPIRF